MKRNSLYCVLSLSLFLVVVNFPSSTRAQDRGNEVILPAGTLLRCTLNEPNFSSKTAEVGDPVICNLGGVLLFDRSVFPRGAYLEGHLEAAKDPGHFVGKGYLKLEFDRIGTPDGQIPVPAKIVGVRGYKVDRQGDIVGHGHATRDAAEWMFPPLWPVKVLTLPARGPRPTLKGEEPLTLRLMDDVAVPAQPPDDGRQRLERPSAESLPGPYDPLPSRYIPAQVPAPPAKPNPVNGLPVQTNVLVLRNGLRYVATNVHVDASNRLSYTLADGALGTARLEDVDWIKTYQGNAENGVTLTLSGANSAR